MSNWVSILSDKVDIGMKLLISEYKMYVFTSKETGGLRVQKINKIYKGSVYTYENEERHTYYTLPSRMKKIKEQSKNKIASLSYGTILYSSKYWRQTSIKRNISNWYKWIRKNIEVKVIKVVSISNKKVLKEIKYILQSNQLSRKYRKELSKVKLRRE